MSTKRPVIQRGHFLGEYPYVRFGSGRENLVILPGITLENEPPNRLAAWTYRLDFGRFARAYTVHVINRRRDMPLGYSTQDMAQDYVRMIERKLGTSHVMGFLTGGAIAREVLEKSLGHLAPRRVLGAQEQHLLLPHIAILRSPAPPAPGPRSCPSPS